MGNKMWCAFSNHWRDNRWFYLVMSFFLLVGIILGALGAKSLDSKEEGELVEYLNYFFAGFPGIQLEPEVLMIQSLTTNFKLLALIWFLGLTVLGAPLVLLVIGAKGFYLGFTAGFLIQEKGLLGILLTILALLPQNIFNLPALIAAGVVAASFSLWLIRGRIKERSKGLIQQFVLYTAILCSLAGIVMVGSLFEAYLTPQLIKLVLEYY